MKNVFWVVLGLGLVACGKSDLPTAEQQRFVEALPREEVKVKAAEWATSNTLWVGLVSDGTRRDGYAAYLCQVLSSRGFVNKSTLVQVYDVGKAMYSKEFVIIGERWCADVLRM